MNLIAELFDHDPDADWMNTPNLPCLPPDGSDPQKVQDHADAWFPANSYTSIQARRLCGGCEVRTECLAYALTNNETGIWGGTNDDERRQLRRDGAAA